MINRGYASGQQQQSQNARNSSNEGFGANNNPSTAVSNQQNIQNMNAVQNAVATLLGEERKSARDTTTQELLMNLVRAEAMEI